MKKSYRERLTNIIIQEGITDFEKLAYKLDNAKFYREAGFIRKFYIQKKSNKVCQIELYLTKTTFYYLKKEITKIIQHTTT